MNAPSVTVTVTVAGKPQTVVFDLDRMVAIEEATGMTVIQALEEFSTYSPKSSKGKDPTEKEVIAAATRFSVKLVSRFVSGCLDIPSSKIGSAIPLPDLKRLFNELGDGFVDAIRQMNGRSTPDEDPPVAPSDAPQASAA
ncbi:MAG: hypothetical protein IPK69_11895 [Phycisphaerales bacterium]|nr:MAG: hypothetical protein IPK69_11895 [Phycisphaerales bacterium]